MDDSPVTADQPASGRYSSLEQSNDYPGFSGVGPAAVRSTGYSSDTDGRSAVACYPDRSGWDASPNGWA